MSYEPFPSKYVSGRCILLSLPLEIRLIIYNELFGEISIEKILPDTSIAYVTFRPSKRLAFLRSAGNCTMSAAKSLSFKLPSS